MTEPYHCPDCGAMLMEQEIPVGVRWLCASCGGAAEQLGTLTHEMVDGALSAIRSGTLRPGRRACPGCGVPMGLGQVETDPPGGTDLDICEACGLVWLDAGDRAVLPLRLSADRASALSAAAASVDGVVTEAPDRCPSCGAPWQVVDGVTCRWCGAALLTVRGSATASGPV